MKGNTLMSDREETLDRKIIKVREQLARLDLKRTVLTSLLNQLENKHHGTQHTNVDESKYPYQHKLSLTDENIQRFASLFRGRKDVFAKRWENRQGRSGYSPSCKNEWVRDVCNKPRIKCADCEHREFIPFTKDIIKDHLTGKIVVGVYPLMKNETCYFLAVDFDKKNWTEDVKAFTRTCHKKGIYCTVERSRSGKGAHVWFFFASPIPARLARRFGCSLLTDTMENRHQIGLDSYDRFFPNQDNIPHGGFGNLIALPLQPEAAVNGNSLFIDEEFNPNPDQWEHLRSFKQLSEEKVREIEEDATRRGRIIGVQMSIQDEPSGEPWLIPPSGGVKVPDVIGPLPPLIEMVKSNLLFIDKTLLPTGLVNHIIRTAAFQNPEFYRAQVMRLPTFGKPRVISCAEEFEKHIAVPRGCEEELTARFSTLGIEISIKDERFEGSRIKATFNGKLTDKQEEAVEAILKHDIGVLSAPTAFGKTIIAIRLISERKINALILVHRKHLLDQWRARLSVFLGIEPDNIGQIGAGKKNRTGVIDVAMLQSLHHKGSVNDLVAEYGHVVVDECHHISAFTFENVLRKVKAKYITGLTATPTRKDGHHPIVFMQCGPIRYWQSPKVAAKERGFEHNVILRHAESKLPVTIGEPKIHDVYRVIIDDNSRTEMIVKDVVQALKEKRRAIILTERRAHLRLLKEKLYKLIDVLVVLHGGLSEKQRGESIESLSTVPVDQSWAILATGRYIGEGFDEPRLDTLFLTMPISWKGTLQQYAGRLHRSHHTKEEVIIYDYVDVNIPMALRMLEHRKKGYASLGYHIEEPSQPGFEW